MNEANTKRLYERFPHLFRDAAKPTSESCMGCGFSCGDGWFRLIYDLSGAIEFEALKMGLDPYSEDWPRALQVKEKFGTLAFYVSTSTRKGGFEADEPKGSMMSFRPVAGIESIRKLVQEAESKSAHICEDCGAEGTMRTDRGWWRVRCDPCDAKRLAEHDAEMRGE